MAKTKIFDDPLAENTNIGVAKLTNESNQKNN